MLRAQDTPLDISLKCVGNQTNELLVLPGVGVGAEGVVNSPRKKVTVDMGLEAQEGICPRDEIRGGRKWHFEGTVSSWSALEKGRCCCSCSCAERTRNKNKITRVEIVMVLTAKSHPLEPLKFEKFGLHLCSKNQQMNLNV